MTDARRLVAVLCLAALLLAALAPGSAGLAYAVFVPLWFFAVGTLVVAMRRETADSVPRILPFVPVLAPRAPPIA